MEISVVGSTKSNYLLPKEEALTLSSHFAAVCYTERSFDDIVTESVDNTISRINRTLSSGHHSVYEHMFFNLYFEGIPKILAMILNNENVYVTSEKSARYTQMQSTGLERRLYDEWMPIFEQQIEQQYPQINSVKRKKLSQENARYMTSVFTPTKMVHTLSFRQLNYIIHFFQNFIQTAEDNSFNAKLKPYMQEFNEQLNELYVEALDPFMKKRRLSFFAKRNNIQEQFGEVYSINYSASFAYLAQAQRHRTIYYQIQPIEQATDFFVPPIISEDEELSRRWLNDLHSVSENFPQSTLLKINERGIYEDFISKLSERLCGHAQLEIMRVTKQMLNLFLSNVGLTNQAVYEELLLYSKGPRCTFPNLSCTGACEFGIDSLERLI